MTNDIKVFDNEEFGKVRTTMINGEPWFIGKDVAEQRYIRCIKEACG